MVPESARGGKFRDGARERDPSDLRPGASVNHSAPSGPLVMCGYELNVGTVKSTTCGVGTSSPVALGDAGVRRYARRDERGGCLAADPRPVVCDRGRGSSGAAIVVADNDVAPDASELRSAIGLSYAPGPMIVLPAASYAFTCSVIVAGVFTGGYAWSNETCSDAITPLTSPRLRWPALRRRSRSSGPSPGRSRCRRAVVERDRKRVDADRRQDGSDAPRRDARNHRACRRHAGGCHVDDGRLRGRGNIRRQAFSGAGARDRHGDGDRDGKLLGARG